MKTFLSKFSVPYLIVACSAHAIFMVILARIGYYLIQSCELLKNNKETTYTLGGFFVVLVILNAVTAKLAYEIGKKNYEHKS